ncbi:MAG: RnfABCDGE type electron transport complex subunit D [Clostridia bacterium]|nr:RnfABCDGE type electron transport complex subunit D [Clostridia bacterium]
MSTLTKVTVSPHIHSGKSTQGIMRDVVIALLPVTVAGVILFGFRALLPIVMCIVCCVGFEALFNVIMKREQTIGDLSAVVTGLLLALNLPANIPLWQCAVGSLFAIILVKCLFGGLGFNVVNPAISARVFMLVAFTSMATAVHPVDVEASATPLATHEMPSLMDMFLGTHGGCIGETCTVALIIGGVYLLVRRVITWHIPVILIGTVFVLSLLSTGFDVSASLALVMAGGLFIGAIFMATDYVTSPSTAWGKVIFALGAGLLTWLIRTYGTYSEGVSFAILFMNILTPYIDRWTRRKVFGEGGAK